MNNRQSSWNESAMMEAKKLQESFEKIYELKEQFSEEFSTGQDNALDVLESETTVNGDSSSGQKTLNVSSTTGFIAGQQIVIDFGGDKEEWGTIDSQGSGVLTLSENLKYTHTSSDADVVETYGDLKKIGLNYTSILTAINQGFTNFINFWMGNAVTTREYGKDIRRIAK